MKAALVIMAAGLCKRAKSFLIPSRREFTAARSVPRDTGRFFHEALKFRVLLDILEAYLSLNQGMATPRQNRWRKSGRLTAHVARKTLSSARVREPGRERKTGGQAPTLE